MHLKARFAGRAALMLVAVAALGAVVMLLWNAIVPGLFSAALPIDYLHALGLLILSRILFGGFRGRGGWHGHGRGHWAKWQSMTPEERQQFHQRWHEHGQQHGHR